MVKTYLSILLIFRTECLATETLDEFPCWLSRAEGQAPGIKQQRTAEWSEMISEFTILYLNYLIDMTTKVIREKSRGGRFLWNKN